MVKQGHRGSSLGLKPLLSALLRSVFRPLLGLSESLRRIVSHARLAARLRVELPASVVVLGKTWVYGTGNIRFGADSLLYPELHLETQGFAAIVLGVGCVLSRGVHLVAMDGITIGDGTMIGEYTSIRDANHIRAEGVAIRDAGHSAAAILIGKEVWIGRGVAVLAGVTIGDGATIGANAVVTRDVPPGALVAGIPARPLAKSR
jgi:acetyltransferase-like isoleucine patch superfamily enzyme